MCGGCRRGCAGAREILVGVAVRGAAGAGERSIGVEPVPLVVLQDIWQCLDRGCVGVEEGFVAAGE